MGHSDSYRSRKRAIAISVITAFLTQSVPLSVWADAPKASQPMTMAIVGYRSGKNSQEEKIRKLLADSLDSKDIKVLDENTLVPKLQAYSNTAVDPKLEGSITTAYDHYNTGLQYYWKLDLNNALKEFNVSVRGYREGISVLHDNYYLLFSHLYLGIILYFLGRTDEGKKFIEEMVMLDTQRRTRTLPQRDFPPKIVELHKQITEEILSRPTSTVSIDTVPSGATVIFNGSEVGKTPVQIKDVPVGQHFLALDLVGYQFYSAPIQVNAGTQDILTPLKEKNIFHVYGSDIPSGTKQELKNVADSLQSDVLILGQVNNKDSDIEIQTQTFDARTSKFSDVYKETLSQKKMKFQTIPDRIKKDFAVASKKSQQAPKVAADEKKIEKSEPAPEPKKGIAKESIKPKPDKTFSEFDRDSRVKEPSESKPFYKKWWFWTSVGVVAAGAGAYFFLLKKDSADSNNVVITNPL